MALLALSRQDVTLVGWSEARPYKAGVFKTPEGDNVAFDAGASMSLCFVSGDHDFTVMKVKTAEVPAITTAVQSLKRGDKVQVGFEKNGGNYRLYELAAAAK